MPQTELQNETLRQHAFLEPMYADPFFPDVLVDKGKALLIALCSEIEAKRPKTDAEVRALTHATTEAFNDLQEDFEAQDSAIETVARETICADFGLIVQSYGFDIDVEDVVGPRDW